MRVLKNEAFIYKIGKQPLNPNRQQSSINVQAADKQDQSMNGKNSTAMWLHSINGQLFWISNFKLQASHRNKITQFPHNNCNFQTQNTAQTLTVDI
jgi:hypothetical protein